MKPEWLIFELEPKLAFKVDGPAVRQLHLHVQHDNTALEAGGVLLGRWIVGEMSFIVDAISEPVPEDRRTRTSFFRSAAAHARIIVSSLRRTRNTCGYLGEWHTHPEPHPTPSGVDLADWRRRLQEDRLDVPRVFFVIVGTASIAAWTGDRASGRIDPLVPRPSLRGT